MRKFMVMFAALIMSFAFAVSVMAAPSPDDEYYDDQPGQTTVDDNTKFNDSSSSSSTTSGSVSPKTGDQGAPASLVYIALAAAAMSVYAAKRLKEQY